MAYTHLHLHTDYSLLDGLGKVQDYVNRAKELGMTSLAITDHGTASGLVSFHDACKKAGIRPILGCEFYEAPAGRTEQDPENRYSHLVLLVKNEVGYRNLCKLVTRSNTEGFYYKPRIDRELLSEFHEGLICLSGCVAGRIPKDILSGEIEKARDDAQWYKDLFGDDFYLEIQNHGLPEEEKVAKELQALSRWMNIPLVCTNDCHYVLESDKEPHEWLLAMQTKTTLSDPKRMVYQGNYSLRSEAEMRALFPDLPQAFDITEEIARKCDFTFEYGKYRMPKVTIPAAYGNDFFAYMKDEAEKGFEQRYPVGHPQREAARKQLDYEYDVIKGMGFAEYFLDTRDTIMYAKSKNIYVGPGRGSGAGSCLNYCLGITDVEPLQFGLLFERFLNPDRKSMPDIDVDYDMSHKDEIVGYEEKKNGHANFAKIQTYGTMAAKGVVKDCARVAGYPVAVGNKLSKLIGKYPTLEEAWLGNGDLRTYVGSEAGLTKLWEVAKRLEGVRRNASTHACGHIPTPVPCEELFPCGVDKSGYLVCQYDMAETEHLGNLKKDLLMLRNLTVIDVAAKAIKERKGIDVPLWTNEVLNDKKALAAISAGDTAGVFQLEQGGMTKFMTELKPRSFSDISAGVALYRPGPMEHIPEYLANRKHPEKIPYEVPALKPILAETYGVIVYQEQAMQITRDLAGFSRGEADVVRKGIGKKKKEIIDEERPKFIYGNSQFPGCIQNGIPEQVAISLWDKMEKFGSYAFNKSHSVAYGFITMQTAYLKANYPHEFYAGLLTSVMDKADKLARYAGDVRKHGISLLPPNINTSEKMFTVGDENGEAVLRYGLLSVKGAGDIVIDKIIEEREANGPYRDLYDFMWRCPKANTAVCYNLICCGAFDYTGVNRATQLESVKYFSELIKKEKKRQDKIEGQMSLFGEGNEHPTPPYLEREEYSKKELLKLEKNASGMFLSEHPLDAPAFPEYPYTDIAEIRRAFLGEEEELSEDDYGYDPEAAAASAVKTENPYDENTQFYVRGIITEIKEVITKKGEKMAFMTIEDATNRMEVPLFASVYAAYKDRLTEDDVVTVLGTVTVKDNGDISMKPNCLCREDEIREGIYLSLPDNVPAGEFVDEARLFFKSMHTHHTSGLTPVYVEATPEQQRINNCPATQICFWSKDLAGDLDLAQNRFGAENVSVRERIYTEPEPAYSLSEKEEKPLPEPVSIKVPEAAAVPEAPSVLTETVRPKLRLRRANEVAEPAPVMAAEPVLKEAPVAAVPKKPVLRIQKATPQVEEDKER